MTYIKKIEQYGTTNGSKINFYFSNRKVYVGRLVICSLGFFIVFETRPTNSEVFRELKILDQNHFVSNIVGYKTSGSWPVVKSYEDLQKVLDALRAINAPSTESSKEEPKKSSLTISIRKKRSIKLNFKL